MRQPVTTHVALGLVLLSLACDRNTLNRRRDDPTPAPDPPPVIEPLRITYRVTGTISNTQITYFSSTSGTTQTTTDLPWAVSWQTLDSPVFLFLSAEAPLDNLVEGTLVIQIFVNGSLFREARGSGFFPSISVSGEVTE